MTSAPRLSRRHPCIAKSYRFWSIYFVSVMIDDVGCSWRHQCPRCGFEIDRNTVCAVVICAAIPAQHWWDRLCQLAPRVLCQSNSKNHNSTDPMNGEIVFYHLNKAIHSDKSSDYHNDEPQCWNVPDAVLSTAHNSWWIFFKFSTATWAIYLNIVGQILITNVLCKPDHAQGCHRAEGWVVCVPLYNLKVVWICHTDQSFLCLCC